MESTAYLIESSGERLPISGEVVIGRAPGVTLWLDDPAVSRRHAVVRPTATGYEIEDLHSANGTYVNDELIQRPRVLLPGDRITIGTNDLLFSAPQTVVSAAPVDEQDARTVVAPPLALVEEPATLLNPLPGEDERTLVSPPYGDEADDRTLVEPSGSLKEADERTIVAATYGREQPDDRTIVAPTYEAEQPDDRTIVAPTYEVERDERTIVVPSDVSDASQLATSEAPTGAAATEPDLTARYEGAPLHADDQPTLVAPTDAASASGHALDADDERTVAVPSGPAVASGRAGSAGEQRYHIILGDTCPFCRTAAQFSFLPEHAPTVPIAGCTAPGGCRCALPELPDVGSGAGAAPAREGATVPLAAPRPEALSPATPSAQPDAGEMRGTPPTVVTPLLAPPNALQVATRIGRLSREVDDLGSLLNQVAGELADGYRVQAVGFFVARGGEPALACGMAAGLEGHALLGLSADVGVGPIGAAASANTTQRVDDRAELLELERRAGIHVSALLAAPICVRGGPVLAVLVLLNPLWEPYFTDDDADFLTLVVQQLTAAAPSAESWLHLAEAQQPLIRAMSIGRGFVTSDADLRELARRCLAAVSRGEPVLISGERGTGRRHLARICGRAAFDDEPVLVEFDASSEVDRQRLAALPVTENGAAGEQHRMVVVEHPEALDAAMLGRLGELGSGASRLAFIADENLTAAEPDGLAKLIGSNSYELPPLRQRVSDIPLLVRSFVEADDARYGLRVDGFSAAALEALGRYPWPGNVAELASVILRLAILSESPTVELGTLAAVAPEAFAGAGQAGDRRWDRVRRLVDEALGDDASLQTAAATQLRELPSDEQTAALGLLIDATRSERTPRRRAQRLELLARTGGARVAPYLAGFLRDANPRLRYTAIVALADSAPGPMVTEILREYATSEEPLTAVLSLLALGRLRDRDALQIFDRVLKQGWDWKARAAATAALTNYDGGSADVRALLARVLHAADILPARSVRQARSAGILSNDDVRRIISNPALPSDTKLRLLQLIGQGDDPELIDLLSDLAYLPLDDTLQQALAEQLARRGEAVLPLLLRLISASNQAPQTVGLSAMRQMSTPGALLAAALAVAGDPALHRAVGENLQAHPQAFSSAIADALYANWRLDSVLALLRLLVAAHGEEPATLQPPEI